MYTDDDFPSESTPTVDEVVSSLCHLTSLDRLHLDCQFRIPDLGAHLTGRPTRLSSVTKLKLSGDAVQCAGVLARLKFPSLREASFNALHWENEGNEDIVGALIPILLQVNSWPQTPGRPVGLAIYAYNGIQLRISIFDGVPSKVPRELHSRFVAPSLPAGVIRDRLLPYLSLDSIRFASIHGLPRKARDIPALSEIIRAMRNVERLDLGNCPCEVLPAVFDTPQSAPLPLPRLRILDAGSFPCSSEHEPTQCIRLFCDALQPWSTRGKKIPCLFVGRNSQLSAEGMAALEVYAEEVIQDEEGKAAYLANCVI